MAVLSGSRGRIAGFLFSLYRILQFGGGVVLETMHTCIGRSCLLLSCIALLVSHAHFLSIPCLDLSLFELYC